jgi:NAD(P)H dehydrogenase (quinone)
MFAITGASGQLGRLVGQKLLEKVPAAEIVAIVRNPAKAADLQATGVQVRQGDYDAPETLATALNGIDRLLLISSSEVGRRAPQHREVIEAAKRAGVGLIAYTSILHADSSPLPLAVEHKETEAMLQSSGIPHVLLRNGWYTENYLASVPAALQHGALLGSAGEGRISSAAREDYAQAAAVVLTSQEQAGRVYELAGDDSYTLADFAAEITRQSGRAVSYQNLPPAEFKAALVQVGLPAGLAMVLAESDEGAAKGGLFDDNHQLSRLIGRPTTPFASLVKSAVTQ